MERKGEAPVFVKVEDYKDVIDIIELLRSKINEAKETLGNLKEMKNQEDSELERWNATLHEIERKIDNIDKTLLDPQGAW
ncbi:hypothetical protein J4212_03295 [Candidatus Woesearchaeota archaeon]|nr:hypothetical protein [Candidatus Woesearchaeota archaeon]